MMNFLTSTYLGKWIATILISMLPIIELRGGVPYGIGFGLSYKEALTAAVIGNMIPVPFILLFFRKILFWLKTRDRVSGMVSKIEERAHLKGRLVQKYRYFGLFLLVAIPLPGTGAWTGALVASIFDIRMKIAIPLIILGVITAGIIMLIITFGFSAIF